MAVCAVLVKLSSPGPVFFKQVRVGVNGVPFEMLQVPQHAGERRPPHDLVGRRRPPGHPDRPVPPQDPPRRAARSCSTCSGARCRSSAPGPSGPYFVEQFTSEIDGYDDRHRVPAGITGWAQVNGYWGDTSIEARVRLDNRYIENWSPWRDLVIALRTIPTLLGRRR